MARPAGQYMRMSGTGFTSAGLSVGSTILIQGSSANNGLYSINSITSDSLYEYAGLSGHILTDETNGSGINITNVTLGGNKIICFGDEDTGIVKVWSYNNSTSSIGTVANAPGVGTTGWSNNAAKPLIHGSNAKYIFTPGQSAIRICDTNIANTSLIKHFSYIAKMNFSDRKGGMYAGFYEHTNTLSPPSGGGYVNKSEILKEAYGIDEDTASTIKADIHLRKSLGVFGSGDGDYDALESAYCQLAEYNWDDISSGETELQLQDSEDLAKVPLDAVIGTCNKPRLAWDATATFGAERMLVRSVDYKYNKMSVYRGYAGTTAAAIDDETQKYLVQYGCGFNYRVAQSSSSGSYMAGTYEFAQSFVYDGNQESLLRTPSHMQFSGSTNLITTSIDMRALDIDVYAFGPYNGRITGGRIYLREKNSNEPWALLVDIDLIKGARTSMDAEYDSWTDASGTDSIPNGCFYVDDLVSTTPQLDRYTDINNYYPEIKRNSVGRYGESYGASAVGGERAWIGNLKLSQETGTVERFGDRVMYSEFGKYDVFPDLNYFTASKGDAEDITALEYFGDRLLIFKTRTVHIWNVASSEPFNWAPERTVKFAGVEHKYSIASTPYGVVWANRTGCYYYDGQQVIDLTENKIRDVQNAYHGASLPPSWETFIKAADYTEKPMVIYSPKDKQIYVLKDVTGGSSSNECYVYNFLTRSWVFNNSIFTNGVQYTNPIVDWNGNIVLAEDTFASPSTITNMDENGEQEEDTDTLRFDKGELISQTASAPQQITSTNDREFGGSSNWTNGTGGSGFSSFGISAGVLTVVATNDGARQYATLDGARWESNMVNGQTYRLSYTLTVSSYTQGTLSIGTANDSYTLQDVNTHTATFSQATQTLDFTYDADCDKIIIDAASTSIFTAIFDNFSLTLAKDNSTLALPAVDWASYTVGGTTITAPNFDAANDRLRITGTQLSDAAHKEGVSLAVAEVDQGDTVTITAGRYYTIKATLWSATSMAGVPFYFEFWNATKPIGEITTVETEYSATIIAVSSGDLRIYKMDQVDGGTDTGNVQWFIKNVSVKEASLTLNDTDKVNVGDFLKVDNEWFKAVGVNPDATQNIQVEGAQFGTSLASHRAGEDSEESNNAVMSSVASFKELSSSSGNSVASKFITKDLDFDQPGVVKKIYKIYITYKNTSSTGRSNIIKVATDGNTTWAQANITSAQSINNSADAAITPTLTGTFLGSKTSWDVATFSFDVPLQCQSIALYLNDGAVTTGLYINDITFEYKTIHRRVK